MKARKYTADEKMAIVVEMLKGQKSIAQLCKEHGIRDNLAYRWRDEALESMKDGFTDKRKHRHQTPEAEKERLLKIIGQQAVIIDFKKKLHKHTQPREET